MRSRRFSRRSSQKIVVNGVRVDAAYLKEQAEKKAAEEEALRLKRLAVRRKPKPRRKPVVEEVAPAERVTSRDKLVAIIEEVREKEASDKSGDVEEDK